MIIRRHPLKLRVSFAFAIFWSAVFAGELFPKLSAEESEPSPQAGDFQLNASTYAAWRDHILPKSKELNWQQIPWLTTFQDGLLAASEANKPMLFWTMNGHPLGCT